MQKMDKETRRWHNLSRDVMDQLFAWEDRLVKIGVPAKDAERYTNKCWRMYAKLLPPTLTPQPDKS